MNAAAFRAALPEFEDGVRFPNAILDYWLTVATALTNADRFGALVDVAIGQFAAHHVTLERRSIDDSERGQAPGMSGLGVVNNKSVDKVTVGYDTQGGAEPDAGHWNLTIYGRRYISLARLHGAGPIQVGVDGDPTGGLSSAQAWAGPLGAIVPTPNG